MDAPTLKEAFQVHRLVVGSDCATAVQHALAVARASSDDPGYHVAWRLLELALYQLDDAANARSIGEVDAAEAELRAIAGAVPITVAHGPPLTRLAPHPIVGTAELALQPTDMISDHVASVVDGHGLVLIARTPDRVERLQVTTGERHRTTWAAAVRSNGTVVVVGGPALADAATVMTGSHLDVVATLGDGSDRAVVVQALNANANLGLVSIVRSHDGGAHWDRPVPLADAQVALALEQADVVQLFWLDVDGVTVHWQRVFDPVAAPHIGKRRPGTLHEVETASMCGAGTVLWFAGVHLFVSDATDEHDLGDLAGERWIIAACAGDAAAVVTEHGVRVCTVHGCTAADPASAGAELVELGAHDEAISATQDGEYVVVSHVGHRRVYDVGAAKLVELVAWQGTIFLGLATDEGLAFAPLPTDQP